MRVMSFIAEAPLWWMLLMVIGPSVPHMRLYSDDKRRKWRNRPFLGYRNNITRNFIPWSPVTSTPESWQDHGHRWAYKSLSLVSESEANCKMSSYMIWLLSQITTNYMFEKLLGNLLTLPNWSMCAFNWKNKVKPNKIHWYFFKKKIKWNSKLTMGSLRESSSQVT